MGGRGSISMGGAYTAPQNKNNTGLSSSLINRANAASTLGNAGDIINREYSAGVAEINSLNLTATQKEQALTKLKELSSTALETTANNPNPFATGRARVNQAKSSAGADKIARANTAVNNHLTKQREIASKNSQAQKQTSRASIIQNAIKNKQLSVVIDGETWVRKSTRSKSFQKVG